MDSGINCLTISFLMQYICNWSISKMSAWWPKLIGREAHKYEARSETKHWGALSGFKLRADWNS